MNLLKQLNSETLLSKTCLIGILPNDGGIIEGFPDAVLTFDEADFILYLFKGFLKPKYEGIKHVFEFSNIKEIEMGKYNFKDHYIKITFTNDRFIAFSYLLKVRDYPQQKEAIQAFIDHLESLATIRE